MKEQEMKGEQSVHHEEYMNKPIEIYETHLISKEDLKLLEENVSYMWELLK